MVAVETVEVVVVVGSPYKVDACPRALKVDVAADFVLARL